MQKTGKRSLSTWGLGIGLVLSAFVTPTWSAQKSCAVPLIRDNALKVTLLPVQPAYQGEFEGQSNEYGPGVVVDRLSPEQRSAYRVSIRNGQLFYTNGRKVEAGKLSGSDPGLVILDQAKNIYLVPKRLSETFHHSSLADGEAVYFSGRIVVNGGWIKMVSDESGHYAPKPENMVYFLWILKISGVDLSGIEVQLRYSSFSASQKKYLKVMGISESELVENRKGMFNHFWDPRFPM